MVKKVVALEEEMEIKVGSEWVDVDNDIATVKYVGEYKVFIKWNEDGSEGERVKETFLESFKPKPIRRTVWLNVYSNYAQCHKDKKMADKHALPGFLFQQEVELIDPREGVRQMTGFTKGPWRVDDSVHGKEGGIIHIKSDGYSEMCTMFSSALENEVEFLANAHLIAAAPDLYEALEALMKEYYEVIRECKGVDVGSCGYVAYDVAGVSLAKARGEV